MSGPTPLFWQERFETHQTGWDRGAPSPHLISLLDRGELTPCRIAVPGCGTGWEVAELARRGFEVTGIDYTAAAVARARALCAEQGVAATIVQADVLSLRPDAPFDVVYEQTCLCALHPDHWVRYAAQLRDWVRPGGRLAAVFMQMVRPQAVSQGVVHGPPYHCDINAMRALFASPDWDWPKPPYAQVPHPTLAHELAVTLTRA